MNNLKIKATLLLTFCIGLHSVAMADDGKPFYTSDIKVLDNGNIVMSNRNTATLKLYSPDMRELRSWSLESPATGVAVVGATAYVTSSYDKGRLTAIDLESGDVGTRIETGMGAKAPTVSVDGTKIYVCNQYKGSVSEVDIASGKVVREAEVLREPFAAVVSPDGKYLFVANFLPLQRADLDIVGADVSVIDLATFTKIKDIKLDNGSNALRSMAMSPDGRYVYVSHNLGRFQVPTSQLQQGWMNTSAISVVDAGRLEFLGSVLMDEPERGAAGVWGIASDDNNLIVSHSGTHDVSVIDHKAFIEKFEAYANKANLSYDLLFLYGIRDRVPVVGNGPRNIVMKDGKVYIPTYFSDTLNVLNLSDRNSAVYAYNPSRTESNENKGERIFNDAEYCFQNWQSCNGCHPGDARTDGMNWDLMNDGIGNPKNCKSLLLSHVTNPSMISGIRETAELAVRKGFTHIQFVSITEELAAYVDDYLKALKPLPSPYLVDGKLSETAERGRKVFEKFKCDVCHSGPYFTDRKMYRIGENVEFEKGWDVPTLVEVWRTAPYLFDGRAASMKDVYDVYRHGIEGKITPKEVDELTEYVNSL